MRSELRMSWGRARLRIEARSLALASALLALLLVLAWLSLSSGTIRLSAGRIWEALAGGSPDSADSRIVLGLRLPRVAAGLAVGLALGASGAAFQSISRNPLGSPDVIGFTTGAATGAVVHIVVFGASGRAASAGAIASGMATALLVYWLARADRRTGSYRLILVGVGVSAFLGALNTLILARGDIDLAVRARVWLSGSLNAVTWEGAGPTIAVVALVLPVLAGLARRLDVLEMGDDQASQLSVRPERLRIAAMLAGDRPDHPRQSRPGRALGADGRGPAHVRRFAVDACPRAAAPSRRPRDGAARRRLPALPPREVRGCLTHPTRGRRVSRPPHP